MAFCTKCGKELRETDQFCFYCGEPVRETGDAVKNTKPASEQEGEKEREQAAEAGPAKAAGKEPKPRTDTGGA